MIFCGFACSDDECQLCADQIQKEKWICGDGDAIVLAAVTLASLPDVQESNMGVFR